MVNQEETFDPRILPLPSRIAMLWDDRILLEWQTAGGGYFEVELPLNVSLGKWMRSLPGQNTEQGVGVPLDLLNEMLNGKPPAV